MSASSNEMNQQRRQGSCIPPGYPQQGSHIPSNQQFSPVNQRYGIMPGQSRPSHMSAMVQSYPQQTSQPPGHMGYNQHTSPASQPFSQQYMNQQQTSPVLQQSQPPVSQLPAPHSTPPHQMPHSQNHPQQSLTPTSLPSVQSPQPSTPQQCSPQSNSTIGSQHNKSSDEKNDKDGSGNISDDVSSDNLSGSRATSTPTSSVPHSNLLRPPPSPAGSVGSRSNTPASLPGNQAGSPMPPRPPSTQYESQNRMSHSPMATQGFNQSMMPPPPSGPNQMGFSPSGSKIPGAPGMNSMNSSQMTYHSQFNSQFPGNFPRHQGQPMQPGGPGMGNFPQQAMFNGPSQMNQMSGNPIYNNIPMNRNMNAASYNNQYSGQSNMNIGQFGNSFSGHLGPGMPPGQTAGPRMSGPTQGNSATSPVAASGMNNVNSQNPQHSSFGSGSSSGIKGAKAAAQAAMLAAAQAANSKQPNPDVVNPHLVFNPNSLNYSNPNMMNMPNSVPPGSSASQSSVPNSTGLMSQPGMHPGFSNPSMMNHSNMHHSNAGPPNISIPTSTPVSSLSGSTSSENSLFSHSSVKSEPSSTEQPPMSMKRKNDCISSSNNLNELLADDSPKEEKFEEPNSDGQDTDKPSLDLKSDDNTSIPSEQDKSSSIVESVDSARGDDVELNNSENQSTCDSLPAENTMELSSVKSEPVSISSSISDTSSAIPATSLATGTSNTHVTQSITTPVTSVNIISSSNEASRINTFPSNAVNYPQTSSLPMLLSDDADKKRKVGIAVDMGNDNIPPTSYSSVPNSTAHIASLQRLLEDGQPDKEKKMDMPSPQMNHVPSLKGTLPMLLSDNSQPPEKKKKRNINHDVQRMYEMGEEPDRKPFLDRLFAFMEDQGKPINHTPQISKQSLDLYKLYLGVRDRGGMMEVTKNKKWKEICSAINIGSSASAAFTLKKNYIKHLFPFECQFDRGGLDPGPILAQMEAQLQQKRDQKHRGRAPSPAGSQGSSQDAFPAIGTPNSNSQGLDPFSPGMQQHYNMPNDHGMGHMGGMVPANHQMMNRNSMMQAGSMHGGPAMHPQMGGPNMMMPNNSYNMPNSGMMGNNVPGQPNTMMGNNMNGPQSNMMGGPTNSMYPGNMNAPPQQNNMMSNMNAPSANNMMGLPNGGGILPAGNSMLTNQDSVSVKDPFSDDINSGVNNYTNPSSSALTQSSFSGMPTQSTASSNLNYNRPSMPAQNVPASFPGNNQNNNHVGFEEGGTKMHNQGPESCSEQTPLVNSSDFQSKQSSEGFSSSSIPVSSSKEKRSSFPFGSQFERPDKFDPSSPTSSSQPFRPSTSQAISQSMASDQMYPGSYGNQMPVRTSTPQEQFGQQQNFPGGSFKNRTPAGQEQSQAGFGNTQGPSFPGPRHPMNRDVSGSIHSTPNKQYSDLDRRDRYMSPGGPGQRPPPVYSSASSYQTDDYADPRRDPSQWSSPMTSRYPTPQGAPGYMQPYNSFKRMSPTRDRGAMSPSKSMKPGSMMPNSNMPPKKEIVFPPDSLEAIQPLTLKRRKLTSKDIGPVDAWRLMLAMKSGLLAESTWALDILNVMLCDESTLAWFNISHLPGLIDVLLDFYRRCLIEIFDTCDEFELGYEKRNHFKEKEAQMCDKANNNVETTESEIFLAQMNEEDKIFLNKKVFDNYSRVTRFGKVVEIEEESEEPEFLRNRDWDVHTVFDGSSDHWQKGGADISSHIIAHFESSQNASVLKRLFFRKKMKLKEEEESLDCLDKSIDDEISSSKECDIDESITIKKEPNIETLKTEETIHNSAFKDIHIKAEPMDMGSEKSDSKVSDEDSMDTDHMNHGMRANGTSEHTDNSVEDLMESVKVEKPVNCSEKENVGKENVSCDTVNLKVEEASEVKDVGQEPESFEKEDPPLCCVSESQNDLERRCVCISNIIRSLSYVPGNDKEFSKHSGLLRILGKLLLLHHQHLPRIKAKRTFENDDHEQENSSMIEAGQEWWWNCLYVLRDNTLVTLANIAGALDLSRFPEEICFPIIDGLLHWTTCPASCARDALPTLSPTSVLSAQRLVLETMCKLCVHEKNVDLILATPPFQRIVDLFKNLKNLLANKKEQMTQEFAIVLMSYLVQADSSAARAIALQHPSVSLLIDFLEIAEQTALQVANTSGINVLRENPEIMGTSLDMLRKAAMILLHLARVPENRTLFVHQQSRLLSLVMSQILDQTVAQILSDVLFECSQS